MKIYKFFLIDVMIVILLLLTGYTNNKNGVKLAVDPSKVSTATTKTTTKKKEAPAVVDLGKFKITAYCTCVTCCGKNDGITATGTKATAGRTLAVDPKVIPYGTKVIINGHTYTAEDTGGAIKGNRIDVCCSTHEDALNFGVQYANVFKVT